MLPLGIVWRQSIRNLPLMFNPAISWWEGRNFGVGSAREQAAMAFRELQVGALLAKGYARIFYRNAVNLGVPALTISADTVITAGDIVSVDPTSGAITNVTTGQTYRVAPIPAHLMDMIRLGGLMPYLKQRIGKQGHSK